MATEIRFRRRATGQTAGAPSGLKTAEPAYNMTDGKFYVGYGDTGAGIATSIRAFGKDDFIVNIPGGGTTGQSLVKNSAVDGDVTWVTVASGGAYTASENGIELVGSVFSLNYTEIATGISLSNYALTSSLTSKLDLSGGTLTGKLVTVVPTTSLASINLPHGVAPSAPVNGDIWSTTTGVFAQVNAATKTLAFTDSSITGSAATLQIGRTIALTGDVTYTSPTFNGSSNITAAATIAAGAVTLAKMSNLAANSFIGNDTGSAAVPAALTATQAKALLAVAFTDVSGTATAAQIPNLDATKITTGVFDVARIPVLPGNTTIVSSGSIANLTAPQQTATETGTIVTTTDGRRWVYNTGSKTLEASYVELADTTPEWSVIANKPAFATVATSGAYADLTGKPTLGTMSSQAASAVAITGGTIDGITLDGGTF